MPSYSRGKTRDNLVAVNVYEEARNIFYAFKTKDLASLNGVATSDIQALGHRLIDTLPDGSLFFLRAQTPKPPRARKVINKNPNVGEQGSVSTFYGYGRERQVLAAKWDLSTPAKAVNLRSKSRYLTAIAKISNGALYAFPMNKRDFDNYGGILGLLSPNQITTDTEQSKLVTGSSRPKPGKASKDLGGGASFSSFYSFDAVSQIRGENFSIISSEILT